MANLYDIISELRREHQTPAAAKTLDMVVVELGQTRDNLRLALVRLEERAVPTGGRAVLDELSTRARQEGVDDNAVPLTSEERQGGGGAVDEPQVGISLLLGGSPAVAVILALAVTVVALNQIFHWV